MNTPSINSNKSNAEHHPDFVSKFESYVIVSKKYRIVSKKYRMGFVEGVTEHFTRQVTLAGRPGHYDFEKRVADTIVYRIADTVGEETLRKAYFQGDSASIETLRKALQEFRGVVVRH